MVACRVYNRTSRIPSESSRYGTPTEETETSLRSSVVAGPYQNLTPESTTGARTSRMYRFVFVRPFPEMADEQAALALGCFMAAGGGFLYAPSTMPL